MNRLKHYLISLLVNLTSLDKYILNLCRYCCNNGISITISITISTIMKYNKQTPVNNNKLLPVMAAMKYHNYINVDEPWHCVSPHVTPVATMSALECDRQLTATPGRYAWPLPRSRIYVCVYDAIALLKPPKKNT